MKRSLAASLAITFGIGLGIAQTPEPRGATQVAVATATVAVKTTPTNASEDLPEPVSAPEKGPAAQSMPGQHQPTEKTSAPGPDSDIIAVESTLDQTMLDTLVSKGQMILDLPDGQSLALIVDQVDNRRGHQLIRVHSPKGTGQFTRAKWGFFGTVATNQGVYAFENQGFTTYIVKHSELDRRHLPGVEDARYRPDA